MGEYISKTIITVGYEDFNYILETTKSNYFIHIINNIGETLTAQEADIFISNFLSYNMIDETGAKLLKVATSDNVLTLNQPIKDIIRAKIFKNMLLNLID